VRAWLVVLVVAACGSSAPPPPLTNRPPEPAVDSNASGDMITFSRDDDCLDHTCPTYRVAIRPDGRIEWLGLENVRLVGHAVGTVEPRQLDKLRVAFELVKFDERNPDGSLGTSDTIIVCADGWDFKIERAHATVRHKVDHWHNCPHDADLERLESLLDETVSAWK
jgi:Domain of unknown function (DUF6438)